MPNLVIVALPSEDDYVNKISSEQVAHMTLLFLGDVSKVQNLDRILSFVEHATEQMLTRFSMNVDRRGELGLDSADVLFFRKSGYCFNDISNFRSSLLQDTDIRSAFDSTDQHDEWLPHLTLGYPDTPANPDDRDYPGIYYVNFDRIAVWDQEYSGREFLLDSDDEYMMMSVGENVVEEILQHHGVPGMKWGHRKQYSTSTSTSTSSSSRSERRQAKKIAKGDKKFEKIVTSKSVNRQFKTQLHNSIVHVTQSKVNRITAKPEYVKAAQNGTFNNPDHPTTKRYLKEVNKAYLDTANDFLSGYTNTSGTKQLQAYYDKGQYLNFSIKIVPYRGVQHADTVDPSNEIIMEIEYVRDSLGRIIGFNVVDNDSMAQSAIEYILKNQGSDILEHHGVKEGDP
jgi:2'-5' RNA ligase